MKILYLLSSLNFHGAARQALLLGRSLAGTCDLRLAVVYDEAPWAAPLRAAGVPVEALYWNRSFDPLPLWRLYRLVHDYQPDCIHVWRLPALRSLALLGRRFLARCIVSQVLGPARRQPQLGRLDRWLLARVRTIVASGANEARCLQLLGVAADQVTVIPPGDSSTLLVSKEVSPNGPPLPGRRIVCLGNVERHKGFREAMRAADYLAYPFADVYLDIIGAGPFLPSLQRFQEALYHRDRVQLHGAKIDPAAFLERAQVCWVPSLTATGQQVALEAMAAGLPVVASDLPHLREIIVEGVCGLFVPPGDETALAQRTRQLLLDDALRQRLGKAARTHVHRHFAAADFVERVRSLYGTWPTSYRVTSGPRSAVWGSNATTIATAGTCY